MTENVEIEVTTEFNNTRLDIALSKLMQLELQPSRSQISKWIDAGVVSVNGELVLKAAYLVEEGDLVVVSIPSPEPLEILPDPSIQLDIVYEDLDLLVINKQAGLVVHPGAGNWSGTLVNALAAHLGEGFFKDNIRPGIVHRLDKDTSGLMVIAKSGLALQSLAEQFLPPRKISRQYLAITSKQLTSDQGIIDAAIARHESDRKKMTVSAKGKSAITKWKVLENFSCGASLVQLNLETGRTHQIRVHLQYAKAAIIGDPVYGPVIGSLPVKLRKTCLDFSRQALHAERLEFLHPVNAKQLKFQASIPEDMQILLQKLKQIN